MLKIMLPWESRLVGSMYWVNRWCFSDDLYGSCGYPITEKEFNLKFAETCWIAVKVGEPYRFPAFKCQAISRYLLDSLLKKQGYYLL